MEFALAEDRGRALEVHGPGAVVLEPAARPIVRANLAPMRSPYTMDAVPVIGHRSHTRPDHAPQRAAANAATPSRPVRC